MYPVLINKASIVIEKPYFKNLINEIGHPFLCAVSDTITFAAAPIIVMLPPST